MRIPIGVDSFRQLVTEHRDFMVDKTLFIKDVLESGSQVLLLTRPRRLMKTSNLSMLHHFLSNEVDGLKTDRLFDGLNIANVEQGAFLKRHQGHYPTVFVNLKHIKGRSFTEVQEGIRYAFSDLYKSHVHILESDAVDSESKKDFEKVLQKKASAMELSYSLQLLTKCLYVHHKERCYVLIDEYDTPFYEAYVHDYLSEIRDLLGLWLNAGLKSNNALRKGILTGILRVAKENLFSDFNNSDVYTILDKEFSPYFGFTEKEIKELLKKFNRDDCIDLVSQWYNGYAVGEDSIYNPWSVINYLQKEELRPYWINTSDNKLIMDLLPQMSLEDIKAFSDLLQGKSITRTVIETLPFKELQSEQGMWTLLLMSGYLKSLQQERKGYTLECELVLPNIEVKSFFQVIIRHWLNGETSSVPNDNLYEALLAGDIERFKMKLSCLLEQVVSSHDVKRNTQEAFYHGLLLGAYSSLNTKKYLIESNRESGYGRFDIVVLPKSGEDRGIILELKSVALPKSQSSLERHLVMSAKEARKQIDTKKYLSRFHAQTIKTDNVLCVGIAFCGKQFKLSIDNDHV